MRKLDIKSSRPTFEIEKEFLRKGCEIIAGIDEAGRGSLAGPLVVGLVVYGRSFILDASCEELCRSFINDSKKLTPRQRGEALVIVRRHSETSLSAIISPRLIDLLNINGATELAVRRLLGKLPFRPDVVLMDGNFSFHVGVPFVSVVKGDNRSLTIASASVLAKTRRDRIMEKFDLIYPGYGFTRNKGYGTLVHRQAIAKKGPADIHRKTYEPVRSLITGGTQTES